MSPSTYDWICRMMYEMRMGYGNYHYGCGGDDCNLTVVVLARMLLVLALFGSVYTANDLLIAYALLIVIIIAITLTVVIVKLLEHRGG